MSQAKCRICFEKQEDISTSLNIYQSNCVHSKFNIADVIEQHLGFRPLIDDKLSKIICEVCWNKLCDFHEFFIRINEAQNAFNLDESHYCVLPEAEIIFDQIKAENEEGFIVDLGFEDASTTEKADSGIDYALNPLKIFCDDDKASMKEESQRCFDGNDRITDSFSESDEDDKDDETFTPTALQLKRSIKTSKKLVGKSSRAKKKETRTSRAASRKRGESTLKMNTYNTTDDELIRKHIPFNCGVCGDNFGDFIELKAHFAEKHNSAERAFIRCCGRKISCIQRNYLIQHAYRHENPEHFKCKDCHKVFADNDGLRAHIIANHPSEDDLKFQCDQCEKRFAKQSLLSWHKASHMPENERKFICTRCPEPKAFANNRLLSTHTFNAHKRPKNVCHICAKVIADKAFFEKHVRSHTEQNQPRVKCPLPNCESWLKDQYGLREHLRRHEDQGKIFECQQCGKRSSNRKALRSHIRNTHSSKVYNCEHCSKTFKSALSLKEHMSQHTGESLYKCPFCERNFNSKANMHSHKKKMHPQEWAFWRKAKMCSNAQPLSSNSNESTLQQVETNCTSIRDNNFLC